MIDDPATEPAETPAEADPKAEADATRAAIAAQGTETDDTDATPVAADAEPTTDADQDPEDTPGDDEPKAEKPPAPKKKATGSARLKARHAALIAENQTLKQQLADAEAQKDEKPPALEDFDYDEDAHRLALQEHTTRKVIREENATRDKADAERREQEATALAEDDFSERIEAAKEIYDDYDAAIGALKGSLGENGMNKSLAGLITDSDQGEIILYHLGKNPSKATRLNGMDVISAAKEIGSLEAKLSVPQTNKVSKAPPPVTPVKGGGSAPPPSNLQKLAAKGSMKDYVAARKKQIKQSA